MSQSWPDAGQSSEAVRTPVKTSGAGEKVVAGGFVHTRLWGYCCPACGKDKIFADGPASVLDGKYFWKCDDCGKRLATTRPLALSLVFLGVCLLIFVAAVTVAGVIAFNYLADPGLEIPDGSPRAFVFILLLLGGGLVGGPVGVLLVLKDLCRSRPQKVPTA